MESVYKLIMEDQRQDYNWAMLVAPLARTPMTKEGGRTLKSYADKLRRMVEALTPWRQSGLREQLKRQGVKPGETVVLLDSGEASPWQDARTIKRSKR